MIDWESDEECNIEDVLIDYDLVSIDPPEKFDIIDSYYLDLFDVDVGLLNDEKNTMLFFSKPGLGFPLPYKFVDIYDNYINYCYICYCTEEKFSSITYEYRNNEEKMIRELIDTTANTKLENILKDYDIYFRICEPGEYSVIYKHRLKEFDCEIGICLIQGQSFLFFSHKISQEDITPPNYDYFNYLNYIPMWQFSKDKFLNILGRNYPSEEEFIRELSKEVTNDRNESIENIHRNSPIKLFDENI